MFKDKYGNIIGIGDTILFTRNDSHNMTLGEIVGIKNNWGFLCDENYSSSWRGVHSHNKLDLKKGEHRIIKITDTKMISRLHADKNYQEDKLNINQLYEKLNK
jgi:hypothetical protein